jgi:hypothetical protein
MALDQRRALFASINRTNEQTPTKERDVNVALERHYRVQEVAKLWGFSIQTIREIFRDEPGVLKVEGRRKTTISIPESTMVRVHAARSKGFIEQVATRERGAKKPWVRPWERPA